jgi:hypothetical protein
MHHAYLKDNTESLLQEIKRSLKETREITLPILDRIADRETCIAFFEKFTDLLNYQYDKNKDSWTSNNNYCEWLLLFKTDNPSQFVQRIDRFVCRLVYEDEKKIP